MGASVAPWYREPMFFFTASLKGSAPEIITVWPFLSRTEQREAAADRGRRVAMLRRPQVPYLEILHGA